MHRTGGTELAAPPPPWASAATTARHSSPLAARWVSLLGLGTPLPRSREGRRAAKLGASLSPFLGGDVPLLPFIAPLYDTPMPLDQLDHYRITG